MLQKKLTRRHFLGSSGTAVILPFLESLMTKEAIAAETGKAKRMLVYFTSCGIIMEKWKPTATGANWELTEILQPLAAIKKDVTVVGNVSNLVSKNLVSAHSIGTAGFLTGVDPIPGIQAGISADIVAANKLGLMTPIRHLQLSQRLGNKATEIGPLSDSTYCDVISWADTKTPLIPQSNPRAIFDSFYSGVKPDETDKDRAERSARGKSVLDAAVTQMQALKNKLGKDDNVKVDQYLTAVREVEKDITKLPSSEAGKCPVTTRPDAENSALYGMVEKYPDYYRVMHQLMTLAFQCDITRFVSFMFSPGRSERSFNFAPLNIKDNMHDLSHGGGEDNFNKQAAIQKYEVQMWVDVLESLKKIPDIGGGSVFDSTISVFGNELSSGGGHRVNDLPLLVAGGGGAIKLGQHLRLEKEMDLACFWLTLLNQGFGLDMPSFGTLGNQTIAGL